MIVSAALAGRRSDPPARAYQASGTEPPVGPHPPVGATVPGTRFIGGVGMRAPDVGSRHPHVLPALPVPVARLPDVPFDRARRSRNHFDAGNRRGHGRHDHAGTGRRRHDAAGKHGQRGHDGAGQDRSPGDPASVFLCQSNLHHAAGGSRTRCRSRFAMRRGASPDRPSLPVFTSRSVAELRRAQRGLLVGRGAEWPGCRFA